MPAMISASWGVADWLPRRDRHPLSAVPGGYDEERIADLAELGGGGVRRGQVPHHAFESLLEVGPLRGAPGSRGRSEKNEYLTKAITIASVRA